MMTFKKMTISKTTLIVGLSGVLILIFQNCSGGLVSAKHTPQANIPTENSQLTGGTEGYEGGPPLSKLGYKISAGKVYFGNIYGLLKNMQVIAGADAGTFMVPPNKLYENIYAKDGFRVYHAGIALIGADAQSFEIVYGAFVRDSMTAYYKDKPLENVFGSSFRYLGDGYFKDSRSAFILNVGTQEQTLTKIATADSASFADRAGFGVDGSAVYCYGKPIAGANPATLVSVRGPSSDALPGVQIERAPVAKDDHAVYVCWPPERNILDGADPRTFQMVDDNYGKDASQVYFLGDKTPIDPKSMEFLPFKFIRDGNGLYEYYGGSPVNIGAVDLFSLQILDRYWWKDRASAYYYTSFEVVSIPGADLATFEAFYVKCGVFPFEFFARDKSRYYSASSGIVSAARNSPGGCYDPTID